MSGTGSIRPLAEESIKLLGDVEIAWIENDMHRVDHQGPEMVNRHPLRLIEK